MAIQPVWRPTSTRNHHAVVALRSRIDRSTASVTIDAVWKPVSPCRPGSLSIVFSMTGMPYVNFARHAQR